MGRVAKSSALVSLTVLSCLSVIVTPFTALADTHQGQGGGQALEIAPPVITLTADPGQTLRTQISLRDVSTATLIVTGEVNDFTASDGEDGAPKLLLEPGEASPYSMKSWIRPLSEITLKPRQLENMPVVINVPRDAAPGGYFSVVRFTARAPELEGTGVSLSASLGALIFVRVNGAADEKLAFEEFTAVKQNGQKSTLFEGLPIMFVARVANKGNVHLQPAGQIIIRDMFGKTVAGINVNLPPRNILPGSIRRFESPLDKAVMGKTQLFGRYTADIKLTYGDNKQVITERMTFWVIPWKLIGFGILGLIVAFLVLRRMIRNYNAAIIRRAQGGSAKKTRRK